MVVFLSKRAKRQSFLKKYRVPGVFLLLVIMGIIFWGNISWIFSGDVWRQMLSDYFPEYFPKPYVMVEHKAEIETADNPGDSGTIAENSGTDNNETPIENNASDGSSSGAEDLSTEEEKMQDLITIPKIGIVAPIVTAATSDSEVIHGLLDSGVVLYPGSAPFGDLGQTVILGHSAPTGWPKIKYDWVFSRLNELKSGDMVVVTYNNQTLYYSVVDIRVVAPQEGVPAPTVEGNSLALVSCWPPGKDLKRIVVESTIKY